MLEKLFSLKDKVAVVTGGSRGIGRSIALAFAEAGADVVVSSRNRKPPELEQAAEAIRRLAAAKGAERSRPRSGRKPEVENLVQKTLDRFGKIDVTGQQRRYESGIEFPAGPRVSWSLEKILEVNLKGALADEPGRGPRDDRPRRRADHQYQLDQRPAGPGGWNRGLLHQQGGAEHDDPGPGPGARPRTAYW